MRDAVVQECQLRQQQQQQQQQRGQPHDAREFLRGEQQWQHLSLFSACLYLAQRALVPAHAADWETEQQGSVAVVAAVADLDRYVHAASC